MARAIAESNAERSWRQTPPNDRAQEVLVALRRIIRATDLHSKRLFKLSGLTTPQIVVLQSVRDLGEVTTGRISARVSLSQGTVTSILDRLESRGLIKRYRSVTDRRVVHARLTKPGRAMLRQAPPLLHEQFASAFAALSPSQQEKIIKTLHDVAGMMGAGHLDAAPLLDIASPSPGGKTDRTAP
ncbi:MAG: winged helix-turn-helix transcriptional regulator [Alphaproteobacteria bacterium]|nr:winged helix-turn-helix transcriptional regulator [Alphaproteobacteria bacterium]